MNDKNEREAEHQMFRHQHRDCDAMGVENQHMRKEIANLEHKVAETAGKCGVPHDNDFDAAETLDRIVEFYTELRAENERLTKEVANRAHFEKSLSAEIAALKAELKVRDNQITRLLATNDGWLIEIATLKAQVADAREPVKRKARR